MKRRKLKRYRSYKHKRYAGNTDFPTLAVERRLAGPFLFAKRKDRICERIEQQYNVLSKKIQLMVTLITLIPKLLSHLYSRRLIKSEMPCQ